jgi:hypothetical protein
MTSTQIKNDITLRLKNANRDNTLEIAAAESVDNSWYIARPAWRHNVVLSDYVVS